MCIAGSGGKKFSGGGAEIGGVVNVFQRQSSKDGVYTVRLISFETVLRKPPKKFLKI